MGLDNFEVLLAVALIAVFLGWYFAGAVINRRRIAAAARWLHQGLQVYRDPVSDRTKSSIRWLATNSFNILLENARPPIKGLGATVLLQSRDMVTVWLTDKLIGRRDLLMLRYEF